MKKCLLNPLFTSTLWATIEETVFLWCCSGLERKQAKKERKYLQYRFLHLSLWCTRQTIYRYNTSHHSEFPSLVCCLLFLISWSFAYRAEFTFFWLFIFNRFFFILLKLLFSSWRWMALRSSFSSRTCPHRKSSLGYQRSRRSWNSQSCNRKMERYINLLRIIQMKLHLWGLISQLLAWHRLRAYVSPFHGAYIYEKRWLELSRLETHLIG